MAKDEDSNQTTDTSQFFLVRLWADNQDSQSRAVGENEDVVRGKVQHVLSGEAESFNDWPALMDALKGMMYGTRRIG
ncbi:MAG TPA: hypothetical protein VFG99_06300 [Chloroflexia bacterium]|nr:hypothetical protein [Chloroflexia bacterium]